MNHVYDKLFTEYGLMICDPPYEKADLNVVKATLFNKGMKENGAVFCHTQGWAVIAETIIGNGNRAFEYFRSYMPATMNNRAEIRETEPYVYCQSTHSRYSARYGASRLPWLTGAAAWSYHAATHYLLGVRPDYNGITIDPCIPEKWDKVTLKRRFRNKISTIEITNKRGQQKGVRKILVNGEEIKGSLIPDDKLKNENFIRVIM
jgi:cellobiose phosphorylase